MIRLCFTCLWVGFLYINGCVSYKTSERYNVLHGLRHDYRHIETLILSNEIQCVRACKKHPLCGTANIKHVGDEVECELQEITTDRLDYMSDQNDTSVICKYFLTILEKNR